MSQVAQQAAREHYKRILPDLDQEAQLPLEPLHLRFNSGPPALMNLMHLHFEYYPLNIIPVTAGATAARFDDHRPTQASRTNLRPFTIPKDVKIEMLST